MRRTFRTWVWEWGCAVCFFGGLGAMALGFAAPLEPWWVGLPVCAYSLLLVAFMLYHLRLTRKYPVRGDLPEFKEWMREREAAWKAFREDE
jgi:hypothetical protein